MKLVAEISMYQAFIDRLNTYESIKVVTTATSTTVSGEYLPTMQLLAEEMQRSHEKVGQAIFVCKFLNGDKMSTDI